MPRSWCSLRAHAAPLAAGTLVAVAAAFVWWRWRQPQLCPCSDHTPSDVSNVAHESGALIARPVVVTEADERRLLASSMASLGSSMASLGSSYRSATSSLDADENEAGSSANAGKVGGASE